MSASGSTWRTALLSGVRRQARRSTRAGRSFAATIGGRITSGFSSVATSSSMSTDCGCTRRQMIRSLVGGSLVMPGILSRLLAEDTADPLAPRAGHFPARAKQVIFVFLSGGFSQLDTFDFKPKLIADHGRELSEDGAHGKKLKLVRPYWEFKPRGRPGILIRDLFPHPTRW